MVRPVRGRRSHRLALLLCLVAGALSLAAFTYEYLTHGVIADTPLVGGVWLLLMALGILSREESPPPDADR